MAKRSVGSLFIDIEARTARLEADLAKTRGLLQRLNSQVGVMGKGFASAFGLAKGAVAAFASIAALKSLKSMTMGTLEQIRAQMQLADATMLSVNDIKAYQEASEHLGVTNMDLTKTMKELFSLQYDVRKGNKDATAQIRQMGFSVEDFAALRPAELFEGTIEKLSGLKDASLRAALSQKVFGKEATNLSALILRGGDAISTAREEMERLGQSLSRIDRAKVSVAMNAIAELDDRWEVFKQRLTIGLTPLMYTLSKNLADWFGSVDIESLAQMISRYTLALVNFIMTIPERLKVMLAEVKLMWYEFVSQFDTGNKDSLLGKLLGTQAENKAKIEELKAQIVNLKATIAATGDTLNEEFDEAVQKMLGNIGTVVVGVGKQMKVINSGVLEMIHEFSGAFSRIADLSDNFLDGEAVKFGDWFREIVKTMVKTFLKVSLINPLLNSVFGGMMGGTAGGWWSSLPAMFGSGKARGGPVMAGDTHVFGENGPEIGTVARSGYITPNDRLRNLSGGGSSGPTIVQNLHFASGLQRAELAAIVPQIIQQAKAAVVDAKLRGGGYRRAMAG